MDILIIMNLGIDKRVSTSYKYSICINMTVFNNSWSNICWPKIENHLFQKQIKIYQARFSRNKIQMYYLQIKLSWSNIAKVISTRQWIECIIYQTSDQNLVQLAQFSFNLKRYPIAIEILIDREIDFSKKYNNQTIYKNKSEILPSLNIIEKCKQTLIKFALEPEWRKKLNNLITDITIILDIAGMII